MYVTILLVKQAPYFADFPIRIRERREKGNRDSFRIR